MPRWAATLCSMALSALLAAAPRTGHARWGETANPEEIRDYRRVSIVFATQNLRSPVSQFGHTFLVFHRDADPEPSAPTVEFAGHLNGLPDYLRTLIGTARGSIGFSYLSYKQRAYELEDRGFWIYELQLSPQEIHRLQDRLLEQRDIAAPYGVFHDNCASYLVELIAQIHGRRFEPESVFFTPPDATLRWLRQNGLLGPAIHHASGQVRVMAALAALGPSDRARVQQTLQGLAVRDFAAPAAAADAISRAADYQLLRSDDPSRRNLLFALKQHFAPMAGEPPAPPDPSRNPGAATAAVTWDAAGKGPVVSFRPGFIGTENQGNADFANAASEVFRIDVRMNRSPEVERFWLLNMESQSAGGYESSGFSQKLAVFHADYRASLGRTQREQAADFGRGWTTALADQTLSLVPFVSVKSVEQENARGVELRLAARFHLYGGSAEKWHYSITIDRFLNPRLGIRQSASAETTFPVNRNWGLALTAAATDVVAHHQIVGTRAYLNY